MHLNLEIDLVVYTQHIESFYLGSFHYRDMTAFSAMEIEKDK